MNKEKTQKNLIDERLETERLLLLPISMKYCDDIFREFTKEVTVYMYPRAAEDVSETEEFINCSIDDLKNGSSLQMIVLLKNNQEFLGCAGLHRANTKTPEFGIWLKKSAQGQDFGQETINALKKWADENKFEFIIGGKLKTLFAESINIGYLFMPSRIYAY